eukprot:6462957-Amphidinium_carterae.3
MMLWIKWHGVQRSKERESRCNDGTIATRSASSSCSLPCTLHTGHVNMPSLPCPGMCSNQPIHESRGSSGASGSSVHR